MTQKASFPAIFAQRVDNQLSSDCTFFMNDSSSLLLLFNCSIKITKRENLRGNMSLVNYENDVKLRELLLKNEYSLNAVNNYGDSLLHVSAAYGFIESVRLILHQNKTNDVLNKTFDRKNKFGWTPLMHAIRANNVDTVRVLLDNGADVTHRTYLGMSTLSIAAGMGEEMFRMILKACPLMLQESVRDDITPLCVAAMKNDKELFFNLIEMGLEVKNQSVYTHMVMQQSLFPEIRNLSELRPDIEKYWADYSDNIPMAGAKLQSKAIHKESLDPAPPVILVDSPREERARVSLDRSEMTKLPNLDLLCLKEVWANDSRSISPNLVYNLDSWFAKSPNQFSPLTPNQNFNQKSQRNYFTFDNIIENRAVDSAIKDHDISLTFIPEFSPSRSPHLPSDFEDEDVCGEDTPTPPHYKTPPQGIVFNSGEAKLIVALKQFDLSHHVPIFLTQEVDMDLFLTLSDQDLEEIGIADENDRKSLLAVIEAYTKSEKH